MKREQLRLGLIGLGNVAVLHLEAYAKLNFLKVIAGADIDQKRVQAVSAAYGFKPYLSYEEMLSQERLDIVCVLTPARTHRSVTEVVATHKVHVFCEKPMAVTLEDAQTMVRVCEEHGVKFFYGASYRFLPAMVKAKELISAGEIGTVQFLTESIVGGAGPEGYSDLGPHHYDPGGPGGAGFGLVDHGIHLIDAFSWLMDDDAASVFGRGALSGGKPITEYLIVTYLNGAVGSVFYNSSTYSSDLPYEGIFSWSPDWKEWNPRERNRLDGGTWVEHPPSIRIHGTRASLRIYYYANQLFLFSGRRGEQIRLVDNPMPAHFALQMESFVDSILQGHEPATNGMDGIKALRTLLASYESFTKQTVISLGASNPVTHSEPSRVSD